MMSTSKIIIFNFPLKMYRCLIKKKKKLKPGNTDLIVIKLIKVIMH